ncbi:MAG TPA: MobF family relaxase, partial [Verrucomicrobiota bacterium]|nr:MobF family relaxase [Verrucomicrobiota bacterium]
DLRDLLVGFAPGRARALVQNAGAKDRQSGWDLTFSSPKSVSTLWSQAPAEVRQAIQQAQLTAVRETLAYLEREAAFTRRGKGGRRFEPVGLVAALFEHGSSRAQDPQLHTHALVMNAGLRRDGTAGTVVSTLFFRHKMAAGALYRAELAKQLIERLGLRLEPRGDHFEVAGVPEALMRAFSRRREEIEGVLGRAGRTDALAAKRAALATRDRKQVRPRGELFRQWQETGRRHGWTLRHAGHLLGQNRLAPAPISAEEQRQAAARITEKLGHFPKRELVRRIAEAVQARGPGLRAVEAAAEAGLGSLVRLGPHRGERQYTTPEMLRVEAALLEGAAARRHETAQALPRKAVDQVLRGFPLSAEQRAAVRHLTTEPGGIQVVSGLAGTGKTVMLDAAREAWTRAGFTVFGACLSGKAAAGLEADAHIPSHTLAHTLKELDRGRFSLPGVSLVVKEKRVAPKAPAWSPLHGLAVPHLAFEIGGRPFGPKSVLVVDEAGMVGTRQLRELLDHAAAARAKVVLVGDARQLPAIEAGAPFRALQDRLGTAGLGDIRRQREPWARDVVRDLAEGRAADALQALDQRGRIHLGDGQEEAGRKLVADWAARGDPRHNLILAATQEEAGWLNAEAQAARRGQGVLKDEPLRHRHEAFHVGDRILCGRNSSLYGVKNGHLGTVERLGDGRLHAVLDDGRRVVLPLQHYPHVGLGYAVTTHKAQGMTTENAFVLVSETMQSRELGYVQASRARGDTRLYVD